MPNRDPDWVWDLSELESESDREFEWEHLIECLTTFMKEINPEGELWYATMENFGWRHLNGEKTFDAGEGEKLLQQLLPRTECTFKVWFDKEAKKITIDNAHHDAPTGGEMYYVTPKEAT